MNFFKKIGRKIVHYSDPRTHFRGIRSAARYTVEAHQSAFRFVAEQHSRAFEFLKRQAKKDYLYFNKAMSYSAQVVTPILAALANFVPIVGWVLGPIIAYVGSRIKYYSSIITLRAKGIVGQHARDISRSGAKRTFLYGMIGSAVGGLLSLFGIGISTATAATDAAAVGGTSTANLAGDGSALAYNSANVAQDAASIALDEVIAAGQPAFVEASKVAAGAVETAAPVSPAFSVGTDEAAIFSGIGTQELTPALAADLSGQTLVSQYSAAELAATPGVASTVVAAAGGGGNGLWGFAKNAASTIWDAAKSLGPLALKLFGPKSGSPSTGLGSGAFGGGEGSAATDGGGFLDSISKLPTWLKIAAGGVGAGVLYLGLRKKKEKAA